jgi:hypothetical protein
MAEQGKAYNRIYLDLILKDLEYCLQESLLNYWLDHDSWLITAIITAIF